MATATIIGRDTRVHARVGGAGDIEVHGHLEGELTVDGEARIEATATVAADVRARRIVVRGAVKGHLSADESIHLEEGARVVGDVRAPRVAIAPGGLVRGYVETQAAGAKPHAAPARAAAPARRVEAVRAAPPAAKSKPVEHVAARGHHVAAKPAPKGRGLTLAGGKAPPPVVPVLKKGTKAALTKRR